MESRDEELARAYLQLRTATSALNQVRGDFLSAMILLEEQIDRAVLYFFAPDEFSIFLKHVLGPMNFLSKLRLLKAALDHAGLWQKHKDFWKELDALREQRNRFAHVGFEFLENSFMDQGGNYRVAPRTRVTGGTPHLDAETDLIGLRSLVHRAEEAGSRAIEVAHELTEVHEPPSEYFFRPGWDPRGLFA